MKPTAISLFSGGPDSAIATVAASSTFAITCAFFDVGQPGASSQLAAARRLSKILGFPLEVFDISSLRNNFLGLAPENQIALSLFGAPSMNCPFGVFGLAATYAVATGAQALIAGVHQNDVAGNSYVETYLRNVGRDAAQLHQIEFEMHVPLINMSKAEVLKLGKSMNVPLELTHSCSNSSSIHCGICVECAKRKDAFIQAGIFDPTQYLNKV